MVSALDVLDHLPLQRRADGFWYPLKFDAPRFTQAEIDALDAAGEITIHERGAYFSERTLRQAADKLMREADDFILSQIE